MKIHTIPLHLGDWLGGTLGMDALECGAYFNLLVAHYQTGEAGLPYDDVVLSRLAKCSPKVWCRIKPVVLAKFDIRESVIVNSKVVYVLRKLSVISSENSIKSLKRWDAPYATAKPEQSHGNAIHKPEAISHKPVAASAGQQGKIFSDKEVKSAMPGDPAYNPPATSGEILPPGWYDLGAAQRVPEDRIYTSWRKFKDVSASPFQAMRWKKWLEREDFYASQEK